MRELIILGAGGFARETLDVVDAINAVSPTYAVRGIADDAPSELALRRMAPRGYPYLGTIDDALEGEDSAHVVIAVGAPDHRAAIAGRVGNARFATLVHPTATLGSLVVLEEGTVVCAGVLISTNVRIGRHCHVNPGAVVGHDSVLADSVSLNPAAVISGDVHVGERVLVGAGAVVLQGLRLGEGSTIGAAACVTKDAPAGTTLIGVPARIHTRREKVERS